MRLQIMTVYDGKAEAYSTPQFFRAVGEGVRSFQDGVNTPDSELGKHPEDYSVFHLGQFDPLTGSIELLPAPTHLASGQNLYLEK